MDWEIRLEIILYWKLQTDQRRAVPAADPDTFTEEFSASPEKVANLPPSPSCSDSSSSSEDSKARLGFLPSSLTRGMSSSSELNGNKLRSFDAIKMRYRKECWEEKLFGEIKLE